MITFQKLYRSLRRKNRSQYALLAFCDFVSVLLITSYAAVLRSPTVLEVLPEGGDSRRQIYMVFALALIGCASFTLYAANLFFRFKSREMGTFLALGAKKRQLRRALYQELAVLSFFSCGAGALCGIPVAAGVWRLFRLLLVDTAEMPFRLDPSSFLIALLFSLFTIFALFFLAARFIRRTNIIEIMGEQRRSEPVRDVRPWCGWLGIALCILGGLGGYFAPHVIILHFHYYPNGWENIFYLPLLIGLYLVLLHTVVRGWRGGRSYYKNIITFSMMKFQGRQTVNNMLVMTLLLAGAYFASFFTPVVMTGNLLAADALFSDNLLHYPLTETVPTRAEIEALGTENGIEISHYRESECALFGVDGNEHVEIGRTWHNEYREVLDGRLFFPESGFTALTGERVDVLSGELYTFMNYDGSEPQFGSGSGTTLVTNTITGERLPVSVAGYLCYSEFSSKAFVMDDSDFARLSAGLPDAYRERYVAFDTSDTEASYAFSKQLEDEFFACMPDESFHEQSWNLVGKSIYESRGEAYLLDNPDYANQYTRDKRGTPVFQAYAKYLPQSRSLMRTDAIKSMAVFITVFLYVAVVCYIAVVLIGYTRCRSIALNNRQVYEDLRRLGANQAYLFRSVRGQVSKVYLVPAIVGTAAIYALFTMILWANDGMLTGSEVAGLLACACVLALLSFVLWASYRFTLRAVCKTLHITWQPARE